MHQLRGRARLIVVILALIAALAPATSAAAEAPPNISNATVTPNSLPFTGGDVTISADVADDLPLQDVWVSFGGTNNGGDVAMSAGDPGRYYLDWTVPENYAPDPVVYDFFVHARDLDQQESVVLAGRVTVDAQPPWDQPPTVSAASVSPRALSSDGGDVQVAVTASDVRGISATWATVTAPDGTSTRVDLTYAGSDQYTGTFTAPANAGPAPAAYTVVATAQNVLGILGSADAGSVTVAAARALQPARATLTFGSVRIGRHVVRTLVVRNAGGARVTGTLACSGAPYAIVGARRGAVTFRLRPGAQRSFTVRFTPTAAGTQDGSLTLTQPGAADTVVALSGSGRLRR